jgi:hypothetical protein
MGSKPKWNPTVQKGLNELHNNHGPLKNEVDHRLKLLPKRTTAKVVHVAGIVRVNKNNVSTNEYDQKRYVVKTNSESEVGEPIGLKTNYLCET